MAKQFDIEQESRWCEGCSHCGYIPSGGLGYIQLFGHKVVTGRIFYRLDGVPVTSDEFKAAAAGVIHV